MAIVEGKACPACGGTELAEGEQAGYSQMGHRGKPLKPGSPIVHVFCTDCGIIIQSYVSQPQRFKRTSVKV
ncbi:hypothetical protein [Paenibacillus mucilaginosus]|uniref:Transcription initiation factor TFIIIB n=1 Tax=Paenibacillus mucilaginosus (strain KNP414) TaxID=1036673 RepID=F8FGZ7_PAEMK|nr:hypothetical protein [Paenibacillus mucilaginosus]AEI46298.1 hypothetical protein KNP414_07812 [Paenibacillus mucilaginosus KNP414]MCG7213587.1 transcription initiation factor TFIIIB [Paenibacillus mucilaginosus]WDM27598.1 transcription initiation factor TFIIIB [Paenibacillus mucilaginosus]